ncbi:EAL domain-containing protein [Bacillus sp. ISL-37]|jgi:EAL domain-containing protein (putative c-di-GMP-specific phosphodiesterase class I)|uniref:EAL domain-containing protein n=1 Tax=Bacillus sp. ISL-37 TaxID=2819123 RepID=UPI001BE8E75F|nr:EAL domain-containing protein [Bacillus sp. ISL-37]MBT2682612.1 EAL domain-containing protein [Bacillus sp. ISL-37]
MARRVTSILDNLLGWGKIILPHSTICYYPPQFILRNPVVSGVKKAFNSGFEVAVIAYTIKNHQELASQLGEESWKFQKALKRHFKSVIEKEIDKEDMVVLHDYYSDSLSLFMRIDHNRYCISEIDVKMKKILREAESRIFQEYPTVQPIFDTGFIFIDKSVDSVHGAVLKAHQQAFAMAEKRIQTEFNEMVYEMKRIIAQQNIKLLAQPIIDVATKEIRAWEMLTRGPEGTALESPLQLFSVARQTNTLYDLEMIVLRKTLDQITSTGCRDDIFINFTPITLGNSRFVRDLKNMMQSYDTIQPNQITLEITERDSIEGIENFIYNIKVLRGMGIKIAVDDTGAGYASLNTISEIMPDVIKIDRSVIENIDKNSVKESMLKGLLLVAREAGSIVIAEGIENEHEASVLSRNKVELAQGYFYARPGLLKTV